MNLPLLHLSFWSPLQQQEELLAYQIGFDLVENELQSFLADVAARLEAPPAPAAAEAAPAGEMLRPEKPAGCPLRTGSVMLIG